MTTKYVQGVFRAEWDPADFDAGLSDDEIINAALSAFDDKSVSVYRSGPNSGYVHITAVVQEAIDEDEMAEMESDIQGDRQQP